MQNEEQWIERLRDLRRLMGWSQRRLAKELRVTPGAVSQWESGLRTIPGPVRRLVEVYEQNLGMLEGPGLPKINGSWASRTLRTSATAATSAARLAGSSMLSLVVSNTKAAEIKEATQLAIARKVTLALGEMKGFVMKLGQMAGYMDYAVPEPVRQVLAGLQTSTRPLDPSAVDGVFVETMGSRPERIFATWSRTPFAAASIGQVHEATLADGTAVAVKVQYPGVRDGIAADLDTFAAIDKLASTIFVGQERGTLIRELRARVLEECDYENEAKNQDAFRNLCIAGAVVPKVFPELSNDRILTTELVRGRSFADFVRHASQDEKDRAGETLLRFGVGNLFRHGMCNADPHPGNYLFTAAGDVAFLDFGCVKHIPQTLATTWTRYARAIVENRRSDADAFFAELGFVPDPDRFDFDVQFQAMRNVYEPFWCGAPFRFNRHFVERNWRALLFENPNLLRTNLPADFLFLNRMMLGLHAVLAALEARADWRAIFDENTT